MSDDWGNGRVATGRVPHDARLGHDMHVTWMLGAAMAMIAQRESLKATLTTLVQPAAGLTEGTIR